MLASSILRSPTMLRQPASMAARTAFKPMPLAKRYQQLDNRGGKSKLIFRIGLKDIPVELYPIGFCVGIALLGAGVAIGRHLYHDGLRLAPTGKAPEDA